MLEREVAGWEGNFCVAADERCVLLAPSHGTFDCATRSCGVL